MLNPTTGHCSPQFHVVFDDEFTTVPFMREGTVPPNWRQLLNESTELATEESFNLAKTWNIPLDDTTIVRDHLLPSIQVSAIDIAVSEGDEPASTQDKLFSEGDTPVFEGVIHSTIPFSSSSEGDRMPANEGEELSKSNGFLGSNMGASIRLPVHKNQDDMMMPKMLNLSTSGLRRSKQLQKSRMGTSFMKMMTLFPGLVAMATQVTPMCFASQQMKRVQDISANFDGTINNIHPLDFLVDSSTNDVFTFKEAM